LTKRRKQRSNSKKSNVSFSWFYVLTGLLKNRFQL